MAKAEEEVIQKVVKPLEDRVKLLESELTLNGKTIDNLIAKLDLIADQLKGFRRG